MDLIQKRMSSRHKLMVFLVAGVSVLENNITNYLIVDSFINGYMLTASTDTIFTSCLFTFRSSSISFRSGTWTIETRE